MRTFVVHRTQWASIRAEDEEEAVEKAIKAPYYLWRTTSTGYWAIDPEETQDES